MFKKSTRPHLSETETGWDRFWKSYYGIKPKTDETWCESGRIGQNLKTRITKNINKIISHHNNIFKIGKTGDSYIRSDKNDYRSDYHYMYLLYKSKSPKFVSEIEEHYIEKYMLSHPNLIQNKRIKAPGKRMVSYNGFYYLYIVCAD